MIAKKKKLSRREIKEDKLVTTYYKTREYIEDNSRTLIIYAGVIVAVIAVVFFYLNNKRQNNEAAGMQLSRVMPLYDQGSYLEAIEGQPGTNLVGLKTIVDEYGSSENGETAKIYLANAYNFLGKYDEAFNYYEDYGGSIDLFKATALAGQGGYYAYKKEFAKAADKYRQAAGVSENNALNSDYFLKAGINYMEAGNNESAREMFDIVSKDYAASSASREVEKYLTLLDQ